MPAQLAAGSIVTDRLQKLVTSCEPFKWAVQNCLGLAVCLIFALVPQIRYQGACQASIYYAVSSLVFSIDRSVGGRVFGGFLWLSIFLTGGLLGFGLVSLAWLARGDGIPLQGLSDTSVDPESIPQISAWFYVIMIVGHLVLSILLTWTRATAGGLDTARALICQIFISMMVVLGAGFMPVLGQYRFWTDNYGSMIKSGLVVLLAVWVNCSFLYVRSARDDVRRLLGDCFRSLGELLTEISSDLNAVGHGVRTIGVDFKNKPTSTSITRSTLAVQMSLLLSEMEPAIPYAFCSRSDDARRFSMIVSKLQVHLGSVKSVEAISRVMIEGIKDPEPLVARELTGASLIICTLASAVIEMEQPLISLGLGDIVTWRPHSLAYWDQVMGRIAECIEHVTDGVRASTANGLERALEEELDGPVSDLRGTGVALLAVLESIVDEVVGLELVVSRALGLEETESSKLIPEPPAERAPWYRYRAFQAIFTDVLLASGIHIWIMHKSAFLSALQQLKSHFWDRSTGDEDIVKASQKRRQLQLYRKVIVSYQLSVIAVVLIIWLRFANTGKYSTDAAAAAQFVSDWSPEYFFLAVAICSQDTVDASLYKAILRLSLIAFGGAIALAAGSNDALLASPYYIFWITMMVNFVASLPATISMDFRYSLFLFAYTFNGVFVCSYSATTSPLQTYAGKSVSTALGAIFAAILSDVLWPSYASDVAFEYESSLLSSHSSSLVKCFEKGRAWTCAGRNGAPGELWDERFPRLGFKNADHAELNRDLLASTTARLGIVRNLYTEVETRSLDKHFMFFLRVTVLPLPPSLKLIFNDIGRIGMFTNMAVRVLRSSFLRGNTGPFSVQLSAAMFDRTASLIAATRDVSHDMSAILVRKCINDDDLFTLKAKLEALQAERAALFSIFGGLDVRGSLDKADVRTAAWYIMMLRAVKEVAGLAKRLIDRPDYRTKDHLWTFKVEFPS